jgi:hypothetical protein
MPDNLTTQVGPDDSTKWHEVLSELSAVMKKHECILLYRADAMVLVKITNEVMSQGRAMCFVKQITPVFYEAAPMNWGGVVKPDAFTTKAS